MSLSFLEKQVDQSAANVDTVNTVIVHFERYLFSINLFTW